MAIQTGPVRSGGQYSIPPLDTRMLDQQGLSVPQTAVDPSRVAMPEPPQAGQVPAMAARQQNAQGPLPENMQAVSSANVAADQATQGEGQQIRQPRPLNLGQEQPEFMDAGGQPIEEHASWAMMHKEKEAQKKRAEGLNLAAENEYELEALYPRSVVPSNRGRLMDASRGMADSLANTTVSIGDTTEPSVAPVNESAFNYAKQSLNLSSAKMANLLSMSLATTTGVISGASERVEGEITDPDALEMMNFGAGIEGVETVPVTAMATSGGLNAETAAGILGNNASRLYQMNNMDDRGNALAPRAQNISPRELGQMALRAAINSGYLISDKVDGVEVIRLSPDKGVEFHRASRSMSREIADMQRGRSQTVPMTTRGEMVGGSATARNIGRTRRKNPTQPVEVQEQLRIVGSTATLTSPHKTYFAKLLVAAMQGSNPDAPLAPLKDNAMKVLGIRKNEDPKALKQKTNVAKKLLKYFGMNVKEGVPRYAKGWVDPLNWRVYDDSEDINAQRDLLTRGVIAAPITPFGVSTTYHLAGISKSEATDIHAGITDKAANGITVLSDNEREYSFLALIGKVLDVGKGVVDYNGNTIPTDSLLIPDLASAVTPEFLGEAARIGAILRGIVPTNLAAIIETSEDDPSLGQNITPEQMQTLNTVLGNSTKKSWGNKIQAYLDAANYLRAKERGTVFTPHSTVEIDMSSAGRTMMSNDIGKVEVLRRVGILYREQMGTQNTNPEGNPRLYFAEIAVKEGVGEAFSKDDEAKIYAWKNALKGLISPEMADDFGKSVLLTTDYGMPISYHVNNALAFLKKYPELVDTLKGVYGDAVNVERDMAKDLNKIYGVALNKTVDKFQMQTPKDMIAYLSMLGMSPDPEGMLGERLSLGGFIQKETGKYTDMTQGNGETYRIAQTKSEFSPIARAKPKTIVQDDGSTLLFVPREGSATMNQVGPIIGQVRESYLLALTMNYLNGGKLPRDMLFMKPVFDNLILNADSFVLTHHTINNIILPKVLSWDIQTSFVKDFKEKKAQGEKEIAAEKVINLSPSSKYYGALVTLDREYSYNKPRMANREYVPEKTRNLIAYLDSKSSGYVAPSEDRPENLTMTPGQLIMAMRNFAAAKLIDEKGASLVGQWGDLSKKRAIESQINARAKAGKLNFVT
jgi:hypothetical protein